MNYDLLKVGARVSFNLNAVAILGVRAINVEVKGVVSYDIARLSDDVEARHAQVFPSLPSGVANDPRTYAYVIVETVAGKTAVFGIPWIQESSIVLESSADTVITLENLSALERTRLTNLLNHNRFTIKNITLSYV